MLDWLAEAIGLPDIFRFSSEGPGGGSFQGTASLAVFYACLITRDRVMRENNVGKIFQAYCNFYKNNILISDPQKLVCYGSSEAHSSVSRAARMSLMQFRPVEVGSDGRMTGALLRRAMEIDIKNGLSPCFVAVTLGTTGCCFFDDLTSIVQLIRNEKSFDTDLPVWIHVDAAYGGAMFLEPKMRGI